MWPNVIIPIVIVSSIVISGVNVRKLLDCSWKKHILYCSSFIMVDYLQYFGADFSHGMLKTKDPHIFCVKNVLQMVAIENVFFLER